MNKILLIEDEDNIRKIIAYDLSKAGYDITEARDGKEAFELGMKEEYDLMIIDWMLPYMDGVELVKRFRSKNIDSIFMMLTAKDSEEDIVEAFEAGVDDYMSKPFSPKELLARINAHLKRHKKKETKQFMDIILDNSKRKVKVAGQELEVTKKEYDLLEYFILNNNIVLSRDQILNDLWGFDYDGDTRIVDVHTFKLRSKLKGSQAKISSSRGVGYILEAKNE